MKIIGIAGKIGSGKTTAANYIKDHFDMDILGFSQPIKDIVRGCFIPPSYEIDMDSQEDKESILPCGYSIRHLLQKVGTEWFRNISSTCWINYMNHCIDMYSDIVIPDVRFINEISWIVNKGGIVIKLLRTTVEDNHITEISLDLITRDFSNIHIIDNRNQSIEQTQEIIFEICNSYLRK